MSIQVYSSKLLEIKSDGSSSVDQTWSWIIWGKIKTAWDHHDIDTFYITVPLCWESTHLPLDKMAAVLEDNIFRCIFSNENVWISLEISLKFVPKDQIHKIPALVQIMAWRQPGDKPLSESMMVILPTHSASMS